MGKAADRIALDADAVAVAAKRVGSHADDIRANHLATRGSLNDRCGVLLGLGLVA